MNAKIVSCGITLGVLAAGAAHAVTVTIDAKDDIFLAGQSSVPTNFPTNPGAPGLGAGLLPVAIAVAPGETIVLTAAGTASCCIGGSPVNGPDGEPAGFPASASISGYGNVAAYNLGSFALVAVFNASPSPWSAFVVGTADTVVVPAGATTLYLGLPDALGFDGAPGYYNDNTGGFTVNVAGVPEPGAWALMLVGFGALGTLVRCRRKPALGWPLAPI